MDDAATSSSSPRRNKPHHLHSLLTELKTDGVETSFELEAFLQKQYSHRDNLLQRKQEAEEQIQELSVIKHQDIREQLDKLQATFNSLKVQLNKLKREKLPSKFEQPQFYENVATVDTLCKGNAYLLVLNFVKTTSEQIDANLENELETEAIDLFHRLKTVNKLYIEETSCGYLKDYCSKIVEYWEARLREKVQCDFEKLLESFGWPMSIKTANPTLETHEKFHKTIRNLFRISSSVKLKDKPSPIRESSVFNEDEPLLPIGVMMKPLKRRFKYHFFNNRVTGDSSKPEWYFCQIKKWMRELTPFVRTHLEPFSVQEAKVSSAVEFVRSLSEMLLVKIDSQLSSEEGVDDEIFAKILEESITFENEVTKTVESDLENCPTYIPKLVSIIYSQPILLQRWLAIEKRACLGKLDEMFSSSTAWNRASSPGPPEIVDLFVAVIRFVMERFSYLEQPGHKLQFVQLIMELLDDFRVRCLQTWQSKCEHDYDEPSAVIIDYVIADAVYRVQNTLEAWQDLPFFCSLAYFLESIQQEEKKINEALKSELDTQSNYMIELNKRASIFDRRDEFELIGDVSDGLFSGTIKLYKCLIDEIQSKWLQKMLDLIDEPLRVYSKLKWQAWEVEVVEFNMEPELDPCIAKIIKIVSNLRHATKEGMDDELAMKWIKKVAAELDKHLFNIVIYPNRFSSDAVVKLHVDLVDGILKHFQLNHVRPEIFFLSILSTMRILEMSKGDAMLLYETLHEADTISQESALCELGVEVKREIVLHLLKSRTDLVF